MKMIITSLYKDYFQKSRVFLYPLLDIKRGGSIIPIETYISWKGYYSEEDMKLICLYHLRNDSEFRRFEKTKLLENKFFFDFKQVEGNKGVYIFDLSDYKRDWDYFLKGKYSKLSSDLKLMIKKFTGEKSSDMPYIESFLSPSMYIKIYAEMMNVEEKILLEVGELCSVPDMESETLNISIENLELNHKNA